MAMGWLSPRSQPTVLHRSPADAAPGDEMLWATDDGAATTHHAIEVGVVVHDPADGHVTVLSNDGHRHEFEAQQMVVLLRHLEEGLVDRSRVRPRPESAQVAR